MSGSARARHLAGGRPDTGRRVPAPAVATRSTSPRSRAGRNCGSPRGSPFWWARTGRGSRRSSRLSPGGAAFTSGRSRKEAAVAEHSRAGEAAGPPLARRPIGPRRSSGRALSDFVDVTLARASVKGGRLQRRELPGVGGVHRRRHRRRSRAGQIPRGRDADPSFAQVRGCSPTFAAAIRSRDCTSSTSPRRRSVAGEPSGAAAPADRIRPARARPVRRRHSFSDHHGGDGGAGVRAGGGPDRRDIVRARRRTTGCIAISWPTRTGSSVTSRSEPGPGRSPDRPGDGTGRSASDLLHGDRHRVGLDGCTPVSKGRA